MKNQGNHARHSVGLILALVSLISAATLLPGASRPAKAQSIAASWSYTDNLNAARRGQTATLLPNGNVLIAGGYGDVDVLSDTGTAELYDPANGTWNTTGHLNVGRFSHTATLLSNGKVLVAGGTDCPKCSGPITSSELFDPATGTWSKTGSLNRAHSGHTATLLPDGRVLIAGGGLPSLTAGNSAELYDPATGTWSLTGGLNTSRSAQTATLLQNGKVLISGGFNNCSNFPLHCSVLNSAELYDPASGVWSDTGNLNVSRYNHTATLLSDGTVLVAGYFDYETGEITSNSAELYDPVTGIWRNTGNLNEGRGLHTATLMPNGKVLVAAGFGEDTQLNSAELYDPATRTWTKTANLNEARDSHTATLLPNGNVLVEAGGVVFSGSNTAELYDPGTSSPNQIDDTQFFVRQHYLDFLNRDPDQGGLAYWTDQITQCGSDARCVHERRIGVSAAFFVELEFQDTGYYVYRFYKASFGRQPNYAEFTTDRSRVVGGSSLEANKQAFADEWVQRSVFRDAYPITMSNTEVVNKLFDSASLTPSIYDVQRQQEILAMNAGRSRALVLRDVIEIPDFKNVPDPNDPRYSEIKQTSQYNPAFVLMQYFGYLRRNLDQDGYDFWLDVVNTREPNNYHGMVCSFVTSAEYQLRFGSVVTRSNADCGQ